MAVQEICPIGSVPTCEAVYIPGAFFQLHNIFPLHIHQYFCRLLMESCPLNNTLEVCAVGSSYLRPDKGFTVIPWLYSLILLSLHLPLVFIRIVKWEAGQWLTIMMALFSIGLIIVEYSSTHLNAEIVFVWTPIILAIDVGAVLQVFILVLERDGERLPIWHKLMTWVHWRSGRRAYSVQLSTFPANDPQALAQPNAIPHHDAQTIAQPLIGTENVVAVHFVLLMSVFCFITLVLLQFIGLISTGAALHRALQGGMHEKWCSPAFLDHTQVFDLSCHNYTIFLESDNAVGCIRVAGTQSAFLKATLTVLVIEFVLEILDATLLLMTGTDAKVLKSVKLKRPWFTMFFGIGIWLALIGIGVSRGKNGALPLTEGYHVLTGVGEPCKASLHAAGLRGAIIAWSDGAFSAFGTAYIGGTN